MPNTGHEEINENESYEENISMRRTESNQTYSIEPDQVMGKTRGGKTLVLSKDPTFTGYYFKFSGGGMLPASLGGTWLTFHEAKKQSDLYLATDADENAIDVKPSKKEVK